MLNIWQIFLDFCLVFKERGKKLSKLQTIQKKRFSDIDLHFYTNKNNNK